MTCAPKYKVALQSLEQKLDITQLYNPGITHRPAWSDLEYEHRRTSSSSTRGDGWGEMDMVVDPKCIANSSLNEVLGAPGWETAVYLRLSRKLEPN